MAACVFCEIARGTEPCHQIWQDERHMAFLSPFPNTEGFSVVITREHVPSYAFAAEDAVLAELVLAAKRVGRLLDRTLPDVGRTGLILEGFGVDHLHAKLFPMHGTPSSGAWQQLSRPLDKYFDHYEGYISSHDYQRVDDATLRALASRIRTVAADGGERLG